MVFTHCGTAKANGSVQVCIDLTKFSQAHHQEVFHMPTVEETLGSLTERSVFSKVDANSGFPE